MLHFFLVHSMKYVFYLDMCLKMKNGEFEDGRYVLRAKIDMSSPNLNMRDPVLYRIKHESHQATGDEWCIYPMYDFSHPIADAVEGITHSLCTLEFEDHRPLYDWTAERVLKAGLVSCQPRQIEFSRLNLKYTVLSKRKLIKLVEDKYVNGWDDPRMPTLSGVRRRGMPPAAIRLFCERMGISKSDSNIDYTIMEDCAREVLDDESPRAFAILEPLKVTIKNWGGSSKEDFEVPRHPKRSELGERTVPFGKTVYIERSDFFDLEGPEGLSNGGKAPKGFKRLLPGGKVRLKYAYVISCDEVVRDPETNEPTELVCTLYPETRAGVTPEGEARVNGIIQWVEASTAAKVQVMQYDRLFKVEEPGKESGEFTDDINTESLKIIKDVIVEPSVAMDALGMIARIRNGSAEEKLYHSALTYQFERSGYFALDSSSTENNLVFNRVVTLRDTWGAPPADGRGKAAQPKEKSQQDNSRNTGGGQAPILEDARRVALRAGTILEAGPHPEADSLIVCKLDCGDKNEAGEAEEPRTVVAGLAGKIPFERLTNRKVVCITNLKPAKMRGIESTAMLLAASDGKEGDDETVELLDVPDSVPNGELLSFENMDPCEPDEMLKSKGALKVWDRVKSKLRVNENGEATYQDDDGVRKLLTSAGPIKVESLKETIIG
jgi:glutaminyl-tRNA synthetase